MEMKVTETGTGTGIVLGQFVLSNEAKEKEYQRMKKEYNEMIVNSTSKSKELDKVITELKNYKSRNNDLWIELQKIDVELKSKKRTIRLLKQKITKQNLVISNHKKIELPNTFFFFFLFLFFY